MQLQAMFGSCVPRHHFVLHNSDLVKWMTGNHNTCKWVITPLPNLSAHKCSMYVSVQSDHLQDKNCIVVVWNWIQLLDGVNYKTQVFNEMISGLFDV